MLNSVQDVPQAFAAGELTNADGSVMRREQVVRFATARDLKYVTIADMIAYRQARERPVERVSTFATERDRLQRTP